MPRPPTAPTAPVSPPRRLTPSPARVPDPSLRLARVAFALWCVSLLLPGFRVETQAASVPGIYVLLLGLAFGWMVMGFAVYANLFFLRAAWVMHKGRLPDGSVVLMLLLAATLPLFRGPLRDEGSSAIAPVSSWGWGAVLWVIALLLMAAAALLRAGLIGPRPLRVLIGALVAATVALASVNAVQWARAGEQERSLYLSPGLAFTLEPSCGVPLARVKGRLLPPGGAVVLDVDPALNELSARRPELPLPLTLRSLKAGQAWVLWENGAAHVGQIAQRMPLGPETAVVQARATPDGAVLKLLAGAQGPVLYEQPLRLHTLRSGQVTYCPASTFGYGGELHVGPDLELQRAIEPPRRQAEVRLRDEVAETSCPVGTQDLDGIDGLREWDGRQVLLPTSIRTRVSLCSSSYIALVYLSQHGDAPDRGLSPVVSVFDRRSLEPLATFNDRQVCRRASCPEVPPGTVTGVRIGDRESSVQTRFGEFAAQRLAPSPPR